MSSGRCQRERAETRSPSLWRSRPSPSIVFTPACVTHATRAEETLIQPAAFLTLRCMCNGLNGGKTHTRTHLRIHKQIDTHTHAGDDAARNCARRGAASRRAGASCDRETRGPPTLVGVDSRGRAAVLRTRSSADFSRKLDPTCRRRRHHRRRRRRIAPAAIVRLR